MDLPKEIGESQLGINRLNRFKSFKAKTFFQHSLIVALYH